MNDSRTLDILRKTINFASIISVGMAISALFVFHSAGSTILCLLVCVLIRANLFVITDICKDEETISFVRLNGNKIEIDYSVHISIRNFRNSLYVISIEGHRPLIAYENLSLSVKVVDEEGSHRGILAEDFQNATYTFF